MSSTQRRAPQIPDIPPFHNRPAGGALQARHAPNPTAYNDPRSSAKAHQAVVKPVMAPPISSGQSDRRQRQQSSHSQQQEHRTKTASSSQRSNGTTNSRVPSEAEPRPSSRLANEKKKDYKDPPNIGPWKLGKLIGQGASGRVRHATHSTTGQQAAVKIVPKQILATSRMSMRDVSAKQDKMTLGIEREIVIMKLIEHPNLLGLIDVYETSKELFLILEYVAGGELFDYLVSKGRLRSAEARSYFRQIIFGLHYCHSFNICHRDLKPENLLLDGTRKTVKVADFGMAALQPSEKMLETSCGSPHYASPEIVSGKSYKGTASDIWSCGIILFALLCGRLPFDDPNIQTLLGKVRLGKFDMPDYLDPLAKDLIWKMLVVDPERRYRMKDIMNHPWFTDNGDLSNENPVNTNIEKISEDQLDFDNLDMDILNNLKTLWPEYSQEDIVKQLTSKGPNWQKTFYSLLVQHRENYSGDDDEEEEVAQMGMVTGQSSKAAPTNSLGLSLGIQPTASATPSVITSTVNTIKEKPRPRRSFEGASPETAQVDVSPAPPRQTALHAQEASAGSTKTVSSSPMRAALDPPRSPVGPRSSPRMGQQSTPSSPTRPTATRGYSVDSPRSSVRPLPSPTQSAVKPGSSPAKGFGSVRHAQQALVDSSNLTRRATSPSNANGNPRTATQGAASTPSKTTHDRSATLHSDTTPKAVVGVRPSSRGGSVKRPISTYGEGKAAPTVGIPQDNDASMQQFFREIADELASIRVNGERPESLQLKLEQLEKVAASMRPSSRGGGAKRTGEDDVMAQFDDAEDDLDDGDHYSVRSGATSDAGSQFPYTPTSPLPATLASPTMKTKPLAVIDRDSLNLGRTRPALLGHQSSSSPRTSSLFSSTTTSSTQSGTSSTLGRKRSLLLGRKKSERKVTGGSESSGKPVSLAYERLQEAGAAQANNSGLHRTGTRLQQKNPGLGLEISSSPVGSSIKSPTLSAYSAPPTPSTPASSLMSPSMNSSPKQSWFAGLFNWKPAMSTLMSTENFSVTHNETKRLLLNCGARVFVEDSENAGVLKCSLAEGKDLTSKPLRFRVEFQILPMSSAASPALSSGGRSVLASPALSGLQMSPNHHYSTSVTLIQEKGSLASFKTIHHMLKRTWTLDIVNGSVPSSPVVGVAPNVGLGMMDAGVMSPRLR